MSKRKISFIKGEYYHIYNRGNSKQKIFNDKEDYQIFTKFLRLCNQEERIRLRNVSDHFLKKDSEPLISIGAYVLMPNHFHILLTEKMDNGITKFMQKISTGYAMYYNQKYKRTGSLFEGKFKSQHLDNDKYLKYIFSYIHLNPIKLIDKDWKENGLKDRDRATDFLKSYQYSSYLDYYGDERAQKYILNRRDFPDYFPTKEHFIGEIIYWFDYKNTEALPR